MNCKIISTCSNFKKTFNGYIYIIMLFFFTSNYIYPQSTYKEYKNSGSSQISKTSTRDYTRGFSKPAGALEDGHIQYRRVAMMDGNLVTGPVVNSGLISYSGIGSDLRIGWPKGTQRADYIWGAYFYVAGEVVDANDDTIHIVSDNFRFGEVSPDATHEYATMPLPKYFNLDQPDAQEIPLIGGISEDVGLDGIPNTHDEGEGDGKLQPSEDFNGNGELDLHMQNVVGWFAISHRKETWPEYWPAGTYPGDDRQPGEERPGVRVGRWNGEFGAYNRADQECYYVMDDRENDEFTYYPFGDTLSWPNGRRGLGLTTEARAYQWNARLAEDILISIYDITLDTAAQDLNKCIVGMYIDPDMGGSFINDDASFDDFDDITYAWNKTFLSDQGLPLGYFGFAFLESPGLPLDGIDNDEDGMIDESQNNGLDDDGDWRPWEDLNGNGVHDNEDTNYNGILDAGEDLNQNGRLDAEPLNDDLGSDGLGPDFLEYTGPDNGEANGIPDIGEPNFEFTDNDESDQVGLTSWYLRSTREDPGMENDEHFWNFEIQPGTFQIVQGYQTDISYAYGSGFIKFSGTERTHRYAIALVFGNDFEDIFRNKRTMQVIYDNDYNFAKPPIQPVLTAFGDDKKVYLSWDSRAERSKDPIYGEDFEAYYIYKSTEPSFNEIKTITDAFGNPFLFKPIKIFDLENGLTGLHPINIGSEIGPGSNLGVTYNMGTDSGLEHKYIDTDVTNGRTYYYAVASVDHGYHPDFYPDISPLQALSPISPTESAVNIQTDPLGRPISFDQNTAAVIPTERSANWNNPQLSETGYEHVDGIGTGSIKIEFYSPLTVQTGYRYRIEFDDDGRYERYDAQRYTGEMNTVVVKSLTENATLLTVNNPLNNDYNEQYIFDGLRLLIQDDTTRVDTSATEWSTGSSPLKLIDLTEANNGVPVSRDYEFRILGANADTSINFRPSNFQIWDVTFADDQFKLPFLYIDQSESGVLDDKDRVTILNNKTDKKQLWMFKFLYPEEIDSTLRIPPQDGDVLSVITTKTYDRYDAIEFTVVGNDINETAGKEVLNNIYTVPDPYIAVSTLERLVINEQEGRGDRRIDFVNLPKKCTISIYTVSGRRVREIEHSATEENRRASWDLRTKDGLEISHGMYFYVVDAPGIGTKTGKFAVIK